MTDEEGDGKTMTREVMLERLIVAFLLVNDIDRERLAELRQCGCLSCRIMVEMYNQVEDEVVSQTGEYLH